MTRKALEAFDPEKLPAGRGAGFEVRNRETGYGEYHYFYRAQGGELFKCVCKNHNEALGLQKEWLAEKLVTVLREMG
jgi:hypothetical protein